MFKTILKSILLITIGFVIAASIFFILNNNNNSDISSVPNDISKVLFLEQDEKDNMKVIKLSDDTEALKNPNAFYKNAQSGDYLIVFQNRVVIFRHEDLKIINIAPFLGGEDFDASINIDNIEEKLLE